MQKIRIDEVEFTGIAAWFFGIIFILVVLLVGGLLAIEIAWRTLAKREKRKLLKRWQEKYGVKQ